MSYLEYDKRCYFPPFYTRYKVKLSDEAAYSVSHWKDAFALIDYIKYRFPDPQTIVIDGTACVGGNTIPFGMHFDRVVAIETNPNHIEFLKHNIETYNLSNKIETIHGDVTKLFVKISKLYPFSKKILFLDPPWGGPSYKTKENKAIYLSNTDVVEWISEWIDHCDILIIKVPSEYPITSLVDALDPSSSIEIITLKKYKCVSVIPLEKKSVVSFNGL